MGKGKLLIGIGVLVLGMAIGGCSSSKKAEPSSPTTAPTGTVVQAADAEAIAKTNCMTCHGTDLRGGGAPNLQKIGAKYSATELANIIANGSGGMPAFKDRLSNVEIQSVADWLAAKK